LSVITYYRQYIRYVPVNKMLLFWLFDSGRKIKVVQQVR